MPATHSRDVNPLRIFITAILNNVPVPESVRATLEANGVNTYALEERMLHQLGMRH